MNEQELKTLGERYVRDVFDDRFCRSFAHYGIKGQKHGVRRFQNEDGSLTPAGERRYLVGDDNRQAPAQTSTASPFANMRLGTKRTEQPAAGQREKVAVAAETAERTKQPSNEKAEKEKEARAKEYGYEPETLAVSDKLEKNGFNFNKYKNVDGSPWGREGLEAAVDQAVYNLKSDDYSSDEANMDSLMNLYDLEEEDAATIIKAAKEQHNYHQSQETTDKNGNTVVKVSQAIADQNKAGTPVKATPVEPKKNTGYEKGTEEVSDKLEKSGVDFSKYKDRSGRSYGRDAVEEISDRALWILRQEGEDDNSSKEYIKDNYGLSDEDADTIIKTAKTISGKDRKKSVPIQAKQTENEQRVRRLLVTAGRR